MRATYRGGAAALVAGAVLASAACGVDGRLAGRGGGASGSPRPFVSPAGGVIASGYVPIDTPLRFDILGLGRVNANTVALRIRLGYAGHGSSSDFVGLFGDTGDAPQANVSRGDPCGGLMLVDGADMLAYHPLSKTTDGSVAETGWTTGPIVLHSGQSLEATILFPAPPVHVTSVDIEASELTPIVNVPIAGDYRLRRDDPDPDGRYNPPYIQTLNTHAEALDHTQSYDRHGTTDDIRLNTDLLFTFDRYRLTPKADGVLRSVARQIDGAKATTIHVDGYTDAVGDAGYNRRLSRRRAAAVLKALKKRVTRRGITYVSAGHGENDPIATNDDAKGRQRNRRVTVTLG